MELNPAETFGATHVGVGEEDGTVNLRGCSLMLLHLHTDRQKVVVAPSSFAVFRPVRTESLNRFVTNVMSRAVADT